MLILEEFKNDEIRNHLSRSFNSSYFMGIQWMFHGFPAGS